MPYRARAARTSPRPWSRPMATMVGSPEWPPGCGRSTREAARCRSGMVSASILADILATQKD